MNASALHTAVIEVKFADPPKDGKKQATIKSTGGDVFGVWPKDIGRFQKGRRYRVEYTERPYQGRTYRTIVKCEPETASAPQPAGKATADEIEFVSRVLAAGVQACAVGHTQADLAQEARMLRAIYHDVFSA
jgi:hypothetical protein